MGTRLESPRLGVAWYPEQWPRARWRADVALMAEAGLSVVRVGEFAWACLEPEEGRLELDWLDEALAVASEAGLDVVLGTPSAAPPAWLVERHPEILPVSEDGGTKGFGHRRHYCPNQPALHRATERVVRALAERFGQDARVIGWQIDNEFSGRCFCPVCRSAFQDWLRRRHGSLERLNECWGTVFWSQTYSAWRQIPLPERFPRSPNPGLALDYRRFVSDSYVRYQALQTGILRELCSPRQFLTHNLMGFRFSEIDYHALSADLDLVSWDNYPALDPSGRWSSAGLAADAVRGLKRRGFWVMEQQVGPLGWEWLATPRGGQVRLWTYQAIAHGAEAVVFFRWRTARYGTEQHWHGVLDADGRPGRRYRELRDLAAELARLRGPLGGSSPVVDVALLHDYDSRFALQIQPTNGALAYEEVVQRHYEALRRLGLGVDVVSPESDLDAYRLVVAANLYVLDPAVAARLTAYVEGGGRLVLAPRVGVKDRSNALPERPLPAWLDGLAGVRVVGYESVADGLPVRFGGEDGSRIVGEFSGWYEELELDGARATASYLDGPFAGSPAVTERGSGPGRVVYIAGAADVPTLQGLYAELCGEAGLATMELPEAVEGVRRRSSAHGELLFLLNHAGEERTVGLTRPWRDLVADATGEQAISLPPYGVALLLGRVAPVAPLSKAEAAS